MPKEKSINGGELNPAIITQDDEFNKFLMTLPENQRQTPESKYYTYKMWRIAGKPKDFNQAVDMGLYHWNDNDKSYHGNSVIYDKESDVYHFLKPKDHSTVQYELDWYNKGVTTDGNGNQYELAGDSKVEWEDFRRNYYLDSSGDDYAYRRRPTLGIPDKARNGIMATLENGVKAALQNKLSSINQSLQESRVNKFGPGGDLLKAGASFIPIVGTVIDGIDLIKDPSWENAGYFAGSLASDVLGLTAIKGLAKTTKVLKAAKALAETEKAATAAKYVKLASKAESINKLNNAKKSARAAGSRGRAYYNDLVANRKLLEAKVAADNAEAKFKLASGVNLFYDATSQGVQTLEPYVEYYNGGEINKFGTGGDTENNQPAILDELNPSVVVDYSNLKQEAKDARDWVFDYYASEGYKNRARQAGLSTRNPLKKHLGIIPKRIIVFLEDQSVSNSYNNGSASFIGLQEPRNSYTSNLTDEIGLTSAHEFAHDNKLFNSPAKSWETPYRSPYYGFNYRELPNNYSDALEVTKLTNPHDSEFSESYSDLIGLRYLLSKHGIFDSKDPNAKFDFNMYKTIMKDDRFKNNRFLKLHDVNQVIKAINEVAHNTTNSNRLDYVNPDNIAAFGGELNRFDEGGNTEYGGKLSSLLEYIAELGTFVPATPMGVYLNTINSRGKETPEPKNVEDNAVETPAYEHKDWMDSYSREDFDKYVNSPERKVKWALQNFNGWSKEDLDYLYSKLGDTGWDPKALAYAISGETNFRPYVENRVSSAIGLAQLTKAQMGTLFGKNNWESVYNSYITRNRSVKEIIDDTIEQYKWMYDRIKTEPDNMGYGRLKVNLLAPNSGLDSKVSDIIFKNSLTESQKDKLVQGDSTYRDLMNMYDDEFNEYFSK